MFFAWLLQNFLHEVSIDAHGPRSLLLLEECTLGCQVVVQASTSRHRELEHSQEQDRDTRLAAAGELLGATGPGTARQGAPLCWGKPLGRLPPQGHLGHPHPRGCLLLGPDAAPTGGIRPTNPRQSSPKAAGHLLSTSSRPLGHAAPCMPGWCASCCN